MDDAWLPLLLSSAFRTLTDRAHAELAAAGFPGVRAGHGFALQAIGAGCTGVVLAARLGVTKQAAAQTVRALEEQGLVERRPNPADARERLIAPTARGRELLRLSARSFRRQVRGWREAAGDETVEAMIGLLRDAAADDGAPLRLDGLL